MSLSPVVDMIIVRYKYIAKTINVTIGMSIDFLAKLLQSYYNFIVFICG